MPSLKKIRSGCAEMQRCGAILHCGGLRRCAVLRRCISTDVGSADEMRQRSGAVEFSRHGLNPPSVLASLKKGPASKGGARLGRFREE